ncbi:MAG: NAD-binding protein [Pseudonocardiaceae bacterium]|nr:NAD-binding protein [Pseudonocardiaceae bacterium]
MTKRVAVLGTGIMGAGMARNLVHAGHDVSVWNRTRSKAEPLGDGGARVADSPAATVRDAEVVVTMLFDADSVAGVMGEALPAVPADAVWAQMATVGVAGIEQLAGLARAHGTGFVDAPVLGTKQPAEQGTLVVLAAGSGELQSKVAPVFDAVGSRTTWVGDEPGEASRLKLAVNAWVQMITVATAQSVALARDLGLDPQLFLDTIDGGATDSPYAHLKGKAMIAGRFPPAFGLDGAVKDSALIIAAMREAGTEPMVMEAVYRQFRRAADAGHAGKDMSAVLHAFRD